MKLTELELKNVLIHKDFKCKFSPNINIIVGPNDGGKTTLFRAIKVLSEGIPSNPEKKFLTTGNKKEDQLIRIKTNKYEIIRKNRNFFLYDLNKNLLFQTKGAIGKELPPPIKKALNLKSVNWQSSRKPHYVILENGNAAAKHFDQMTGSNDFELLIKTLKEEISDSKSEIKSLEKQKEQTISILNDLQKINFKKGLNLIKDYTSTQETINLNIIIIENLNNEITTLKRLIRAIPLSKIIKLQKQLDVVKESTEEQNQNSISIENIKTKIELLSINTSDINELLFIQSKLEKISNELKKYQEINDILIDINLQIERLQAFDRTLKSKNEIFTLEQRIERKKKELKICPFCEKKI